MWHRLRVAVLGYQRLGGKDREHHPVELPCTAMRSIHFTAEDRRSLAHDRYHHPDPRVQRKIEVLWLKSHGLGHDDIATLADVSRRTVQRYSLAGPVLPTIAEGDGAGTPWRLEP